MKKVIVFLFLLVVMMSIVSCAPAADVASRNISVAADNFEIDRRIVFINGITDNYLLEIQGKCSLGNYDDSGELTVTCKVGPDKFKKHFLGLSDNVTYVVEQVDGYAVNDYHYRAIFRPETLVPDIELQIEN